MILEICAYNVQSCIIAQKGGASRIELCADPYQGGTTPSYGMIKYAMEHIDIPVYPIIRPRGGEFVCDSIDLEIMKTDILMCKELGCKGISTGVATVDGKIDKESMKRIKEWAGNMEISCHKVFDATPVLFSALEDLIEVGCTRVLTSGGCKTAIEGIDIIAKLVTQAAGRIIVMPGGSVRSGNIMELINKTRANEFHSSAIINNNNYFIADEKEISELKNKMLYN